MLSKLHWTYNHVPRRGQVLGDGHPGPRHFRCPSGPTVLSARRGRSPCLAHPALHTSRGTLARGRSTPPTPAPGTGRRQLLPAARAVSKLLRMPPEPSSPSRVKVPARGRDRSDPDGEGRRAARGGQGSLTASRHQEAASGILRPNQERRGHEGSRAPARESPEVTPPGRDATGRDSWGRAMAREAAERPPEETLSLWKR